MVAKDIMTTGVVTITPETPVSEIARLLLAHRISATPVVDADGRLRGIVSEGDLMRRRETGTERPRSWWLELFGGAGDLARDYVKTHGQRAADVMTTSVVTVEEDTSLAEIARLLEERRIKRVPVLRDGRVVGIVSRADLLRGLASRTPAHPPVSEDDRTLRAGVLRELEAAGVVPLAYVNVVVTDGVVHLWGLVEDEEQRRACLVAAQSVPGVRAVEDHLGWVPPYVRST
jgi:CBS-domain-containing membrane protein